VLIQIGNHKTQKYTIAPT